MSSGLTSQVCLPGCPGNLLATRQGDLCYLDFGMMSEAPQNARYAIIAHVVHLVNRDYQVGWITHRSCAASCLIRHSRIQAHRGQTFWSACLLRVQFAFDW